MVYYFHLNVGRSRMSDSKSPVPLQSDQPTAYPHDGELSSFAQNVLNLESLLFRSEIESAKPDVDVQRLKIYQSDISSLQSELIVQLSRAASIAGESDPIILRLQGLQPKLERVIENAEKRVAGILQQRVDLQSKHEAEMDRIDEMMADARASPDRAHEYSEAIQSSAEQRNDSPPLLAIDSQQEAEEDNHMNLPSREEIDAKFETIEARMDGRVRSIEGKIDTLVATMTGQQHAMTATITGHEQAMSMLAERATKAAESAAAAADRAATAADRAGGLKQTLWATSLTTVLSVLAIALAAYFGTQQSNMGLVQTTLGAFEAGRVSVDEAPPIRQTDESVPLKK